MDNNGEMIKGKKYYEIALMERVPNSAEDDFVSLDYVQAKSYREAVKMAKALSESFDACDILCYTATEDTSYYLFFRETYVNRECIGRIDFD